MHFVEKISEDLSLRLVICDDLIIMVVADYSVRFSLARNRFELVTKFGTVLIAPLNA